MGKIVTFWRYIKFGFNAGNNWRSRLILITLLPRLKFKSFWGLSDKRIWQVRVNLAGRSLPLTFRTQDIFMLYELLQTDPYFSEWLRKNPPKHIVDLGAHIGLATLRFKIYFPKAIIHSYEPDPENFYFLSQNTNNIKGVFLHQQAAGSTTGRGELYTLPNRRSANSLIPSQKDTQVVKIPCEVISLDDILKEIGGADLIKFDIEGAENEVFRASKLVHNVPFIVGEVKKDKRGVQDFLVLFPEHKSCVRSVAPKMYIIELNKEQ